MDGDGKCVLGLTWPWRVLSRPPVRSILNLSASLMISASTGSSIISYCMGESDVGLEPHQGLGMARGIRNLAHTAA